MTIQTRIDKIEQRLKPKNDELQINVTIVDGPYSPRQSQPGVKTIYITGEEQR